MGEHPRISISDEIRDIHLVYGQTFTLWLQEKDSKRRHQIEVRITEEGKMEMFINKKENPVKIKDFSEWESMN